jgi:hypothetical protein
MVGAHGYYSPELNYWHNFELFVGEHRLLYLNVFRDWYGANSFISIKELFPGAIISSNLLADEIEIKLPSQLLNVDLMSLNHHLKSNHSNSEYDPKWHEHSRVVKNAQNAPSGDDWEFHIGRSIDVLKPIELSFGHQCKYSAIVDGTRNRSNLTLKNLIIEMKKAKDPFCDRDGSRHILVMHYFGDVDKQILDQMKDRGSLKNLILIYNKNAEQYYNPIFYNRAFFAHLNSSRSHNNRNS